MRGHPNRTYTRHEQSTARKERRQRSPPTTTTTADNTSPRPSGEGMPSRCHNSRIRRIRRAEGGPTFRTRNGGDGVAPIDEFFVPSARDQGHACGRDGGEGIEVRRWDGR